ncbi:MAG: hypothetical protein ACE5JG_07950 [Planctomycetota bacterium]
MDRRTRRRELIRLMRPALAPTATADVLAAGVLTGAPVFPLAAAALGSTLLYVAGMVQNDLFDRERDGSLHPDRPLVLHPELMVTARLLSWGGFAGGLALAAVAGALLPALGVVFLATLYNAKAKARFPGDCLALGGARACNLWIGLAVAGAALDDVNLAYLVSYLLFIGGLTGASRAEDMEPPETRRLALLLSLVPQLLALGGFASRAARDAPLFLLPAAYVTFWFARAMASGTRAAAMHYVLAGLMGIYLIHAATLWTTRNQGAVLLVLGCAALSVALLRAAPRAGRPADA